MGSTYETHAHFTSMELGVQIHQLLSRNDPRVTLTRIYRGPPYRDIYIYIYFQTPEPRNPTQMHIFEFYMDPGGPGAIGKAFWEWYASF
jgi:hypothetical protein